MFTLILSSLYFILPAYLANMAPVIAKKLKFPFEISINAKLFGSHKTWRGFYTAYFGALLVLLLQQYLQNKGLPQNISLLDYNQINLFLFAFLFGIGAMTGDLIKSIFKRRKGIKPGGVWFPWDQLDFVLGALLFTWFFYALDPIHIIVIILATPLLHFLSNLIGYFLGVKDVWW